MRIHARHYETGELVEILCEGSRIESVAPPSINKPDVRAGWAAPALFDLQINGCDSRSFNSEKLTVEETLRVFRSFYPAGPSVDDLIELVALKDKRQVLYSKLSGGQKQRVAVAWFGDGASSRADTHEAMNLAGVLRLPVVFVCDNNQFAYSTPTHLEYACETIADRAAVYGFEGVTVDGTDVLAVYREAKWAIEKAREGGGPTLIESVTLRMEGHAVHDDAFYVPKEMFEEWAKNDPVERFRTWLDAHAELTREEEDEIGAGVKKLLNDALSRAEESPLPDTAKLADGVYATPEDLDTPHHK